jgi:rhamnosyltransferase
VCAASHKLSLDSVEARILAVVVTYHPDDLFPARIDRLARQVDSVLVIDNHSNSAAVSMLRGIDPSRNVRLILNSENLGMAAALNIGVRSAIAAGYEWVATFDQDSTIEGKYFENLLQVYASCAERKSVAILSPVYREEGAGAAPLRTKHVDVPFVEVQKTITSGSLIKTSCFLSVGLFDESLYIDLVDHEFSLRLMKAGYRMIRSNTCILSHRLGTTTAHQFCGLRFYSTGHDSTRRYYMARNRIAVYKRYATFKPLWILKDALSLVKEVVKIALVEENAVSKLLATVQGIFDGIFGKSGRR